MNPSSRACIKRASKPMLLNLDPDPRFASRAERNAPAMLGLCWVSILPVLSSPPKPRNPAPHKLNTIINSVAPLAMQLANPWQNWKHCHHYQHLLHSKFSLIMSFTIYCGLTWNRTKILGASLCPATLMIYPCQRWRTWVLWWYLLWFWNSCDLKTPTWS